ncbi:MAG: DUF4489 domain-containing protein [Syntrophomonadaceae bacterium]|nr:DUF4489 domain-containing protein [Syntrophomonadaceae bacterium]MDD3890216.1 DUF4489 domain-containing protein [Syntrophomonadaceae bacterium]MDD4549443.1 DUF4489 domain-containing protein [Syntrophomonadaceae bacterium]
MTKYKLEPHFCSPEGKNQVILNCSTGTGVILPSHNEEHSQLFNPYVIATVPLDTSFLSNPTVKVDFSSIITYKESGSYPSDLRITFQLSKVCNGVKIGMGTWNFERFFDKEYSYGGSGRAVAGQETAQLNGGGYYSSITAQTVDTFDFVWCGCQDCPGCCHFMVEVINVESKNVDFAAVTNCMINAIAVGPMMHGD